jgi:formamidopyrimidine-DNA glycosylase
MPELPEVETIAKQLRKVIVGKEIEDIQILREKSFGGDSKSLLGKKVTGVFRRAKVLGFEVGEEKRVIVHLKMTGQLIWRPKDWSSKNRSYEIVGGHPSEDWVGNLPSKHTRVIWTFGDGSKLFFNDMRVFGWMKVLTSDELDKLFEKSPPDVIDEDFTLEYFESATRNVNRPIKIVIMDTAKMGGVGNIYANDALWESQILPSKKAKDLDAGESERLYQAIKDVIKLGIKHGGATSANYVNLDGLGGSYQDHFRVYKRDGEKCFRCGEKIVKNKVGGRGTFWCPVCQK